MKSWVTRKRFALALLLAALSPSSHAFAAPAASPVMRNVLSWRVGSLLDWKPITPVDTYSTLDINVLHVFPNPEVSDGLSPGGEKPLAMTQEAIDTLWRGEVAQLHEKGIRVWGGAASTCFVPQRFRNYGMNPELYFARDPEGKPSMMLGGSFGPDLMTACYNNPLWMTLLRDTALAYQEAGFDGIWWDVGGYGDPPVYFCHCEHCSKDWKAFALQAGLPENTIQPTKEGGWNFANAVNRAHFRWRLQVYEKNFGAIRDALKAKNPDFMFLHNEEPLWMESYSTAVSHLHDLPQCEEYGHSSAPFSLLPNYLSGRALTDGAPLVLVQNDNPRRNATQHRIALAEAYAAGGVLQNRNFPDENQRFYKYLDANEELYVGQESMADVAIVYSFWSRFFYEIGEKAPHDAPRPQYWMGWMLQDLHVPYDFLFVEKSFTLKDLQRYRVLVLSDLAVLDDTQLAVLSEYLKHGGRILATGNTAKFDLEMGDRGCAGLTTITGALFEDGQQLRVGDGRWVYLPGNPAADYNTANPRNAAADAVLSPPAAPPAAVAEALNWLLDSAQPVTLEARNTTAIVPQRQPGRILLHLINYNMYPDGQTLTPDEHIRAHVRLPEKTTVQSARAISPDWEGSPHEVALEQADNQATVTLDKLDTYAVVVLELENK